MQSWRNVVASASSAFRPKITRGISDRMRPSVRSPRLAWSHGRTGCRRPVGLTLSRTFSVVIGRKSPITVERRTPSSFIRWTLPSGRGHINPKSEPDGSRPIRRAVIRVYDETGNVIETHEHNGDFKNY